LPNHTKVIPCRKSAEVERWRFYDCLEGRTNPVADWYESLSEDGQYTFDALLKAHCKANLPTEWNSCKLLQGECKPHGIWEWVFFDTGHKRQERLLGIFADERKKAIFLIGCYHKQKRYTPSDCLPTAIRRAKEVRNGTAQFEERTIREDF
jgi:hypothetical protein